MTRMTGSTRWLASMAVALGLAVPAIADAQAIPRPGTSGSSSGSSGGSSSSGGGGGDVTPPPSSGSSRGSSGSSGSSAAPSPKVGSLPGSGAPSKGAASTSGGSRRTAPEPGGLVGGRVSERTRGASDPDVTRVASSLSEPAYMRLRGVQPVTGTATPRPAGLQGGFVSFPLFGPWGRWYPWYGSGFGWNYGYVSFDPWRYGATAWIWGRYGMWYDPWGYSWNPYYSSPSRDASYAEPRRTTGSLRLRVDPSEAQVYVDGVLVGVVDDFNGLTDHLEVEGGKRVLEIRAEGYVTYTDEVKVDIGKTKTVRVNLKKVG
jgi:hypothetical protein